MPINKDTFKVSFVERSLEPPCPQVWPPLKKLWESHQQHLTKSRTGKTSLGGERKAMLYRVIHGNNYLQVPEGGVAQTNTYKMGSCCFKCSLMAFFLLVNPKPCCEQSMTLPAASSPWISAIFLQWQPCHMWLSVQLWEYDNYCMYLGGERRLGVSPHLEPLENKVWWLISKPSSFKFLVLMAEKLTLKMCGLQFLMKSQKSGCCWYSWSSVPPIV